MANSLRAKLSKLRHDRHITEEEYQAFLKKIDGHDKKIREDAIDEVKREFTEIIQGNEEFIDWQKEEILLCLECAIENIKEQSNDR